MTTTQRSAEYRAGWRTGRAQGFKDAMRAMTRFSTAAYDRDMLLLAKYWFELKGEALVDEDESGSEYWRSEVET